MPNWKDMSAYELDAQPPSYDTMIQTEQKKIKQRVKRTIMPKVRAKVAALGKAKVAEKKLVGKKIIAKAKKMDGRIKEKRRVEKGKKEIIRGIKKIGATALAKKKAAGARIKAKASVAAKMPSIQQKVRDLGKSMIAKKKAKKKDYTSQLNLPSWSSFGGVYGTKHFIRKNKKTGSLQYKKGSGGDPNIAGNWINVDSKGITIDESKEHRGFFRGDVKDFRHYVIDKAPAEEEEEPNPEADDLRFRTEPDPEADTDSEDELDVYQIYLDGRHTMNYLADDGRVFDPDTQERIPTLERVFRKMWKRQGFKSSSEALANKAFVKKLETDPSG